jgi:hypothetical protein
MTNEKMGRATGPFPLEAMQIANGTLRTDINVLTQPPDTARNIRDMRGAHKAGLKPNDALSESAPQR